MDKSAALALLATLVMSTPALAQDASIPQMPVIVTSGEAIVTRAPDQAFVTIAVETRDNSPREAQKRNADAMSSVQQRIARAGIPRDAVRTTGYSIQQEFDFANGRRTPRGYVAHNGVEVRVDAVERVGELLDAMVEAGANAVSSVRFDLKDRAAVEREALRLAVVDARARADALAAGAGRSVDRVLRITDGSEPIVRPLAQPRMMAMAPGAAPETPIESGPIEVHARVELTVSIR
jgi:uncharacterized protein YggE